MSETDLQKLGAAYLRARDRAEVARLALHEAIRVEAEVMSEAQIARVAGVQRETVRKALGK